MVMIRNGCSVLICLICYFWHAWVIQYVGQIIDISRQPRSNELGSLPAWLNLNYQPAPMTRLSPTWLNHILTHVDPLTTLQLLFIESASFASSWMILLLSILFVNISFIILFDVLTKNISLILTVILQYQLIFFTQYIVETLV